MKKFLVLCSMLVALGFVVGCPSGDTPVTAPPNTTAGGDAPADGDTAGGDPPADGDTAGGDAPE